MNKSDLHDDGYRRHDDGFFCHDDECFVGEEMRVEPGFQ